MEIIFNITKEGIEEMEAEDYEAFERAQDGEVRLYRLRPAIARFMVDEHNKPIPHPQAMKISGRMKLKDMKSFISKFFDIMRDTAVPKANGNSSSLPSEAVTAV
jgi:hypothetical protein